MSLLTSTLRLEMRRGIIVNMNLSEDHVCTTDKYNPFCHQIEQSELIYKEGLCQLLLG